MPQPERLEILILGSGTGGKLLAWHMAQAGRRTAVVERRWIGGSCPNIACMPSKNEIWSAKVAHIVKHAAEFGMTVGPVGIDMAVVRQRKRDMVEAQIAAHLQNYEASGAELIMGSGRFITPKTLEVSLNNGATRVLTGDYVFVNVGTHAAMPDIPGLEAARPLTNIEALELDYLPPHLIVLGGGYMGLELAQAYRRFGSRVTVVEQGRKLLVGASDDRILGFTMIGSEAGEVMAAVQIAMLACVPYPVLRDAIFAHPTMVEGLDFLLAKVPTRCDQLVLSAV
jgi:pyruvate/2-oxoglutarate dehydrogenase complex dihydrolipoamide dehydrogenase (E3) component